MLRTLQSLRGQIETNTASLATLSTNALQLFADLAMIAPENDDAQNNAADLSIEQQHQRLVLWTSNLGATHLGHSSLDYRLRQADLVRNTIEAFLKDLCGSLLECKEFLLYGDLSAMDDVDASDQAGRSCNYPDQTVAAAQQLMLEADYGLESGGLEEQDLSLILESISETINCLYRIATRIRNPGTRTLTKKVLEFAIIDRDGVDLTEQYALLDRKHLCEVFRDYRSADDLASSEEQGILPHPLDLAGGEPLDFLAQRLAQANTIRRKQFAYWSRHRKKLDMAPEATARVLRVQQPPLTRSVHVDGSVISSLPTTATTLNPTQIDLEDAKSIATISDFAGLVRSVPTTTREISEIPEPPSNLKGQRYFECPYCLTLCSGAYLERKAWRSHLLRDLRPYVCTYRDCVEGKCLFDTRQEWIAHEESCHRRIWRCLEHPEATFPTVAAYKNHISDVHVSNRIDMESTELLRAGESALEVADRPCPICFADIPDATALQQHIAAHLVRIALFSLPRSTGADDHTDSGTSWSGRANGHHSDYSQLTSSESASSSAYIRVEGMGSPPIEKSGKTTDLSRNALRHLETITSDQGSNAKVKQFLSQLTAAPPDFDTSASKMEAFDDGSGALHASAYASSQDRFSNIEPASKAEQPKDQDTHLLRQDSDRPLLPATLYETDKDSRCQRCGEVLIDEEKIIVLADKRWHAHCFRCHTCHADFGPESLLLLGDGSLLCDKCTYRCDACGNKIEDLAILAGDQAFCAACFTCRCCKRKIETLRCARTSQGIFCTDCHDGLTARRRKKKAILERQERLDNDIKAPSVHVNTDLDQQGIAADDQKDGPDSAPPRPSSLSPTAATQQPSLSLPTTGPSTTPDEQVRIVPLVEAVRRREAEIKSGSPSAVSRSPAPPRDLRIPSPT